LKNRAKLTLKKEKERVNAAMTRLGICKRSAEIKKTPRVNVVGTGTIKKILINVSFD
jgi:hypothetical protein